MHSAGGLECIEPCVVEIASQEGVGEALWAGVVLSRQVLLARLGRAITHVRSSVKEAAHVEALFRVLNLVSRCRELSWSSALLLNGGLVRLNLVVDHHIKLTILSHLLKNFVLVGLQRILQGNFSLTLNSREMNK